MKAYYLFYCLIIFFNTGCFMMDVTPWTKDELKYMKKCTNHIHSRKECTDELLKIRRLEWEKTKKPLTNQTQHSKIQEDSNTTLL